MVALERPGALLCCAEVSEMIPSSLIHFPGCGKTVTLGSFKPFILIRARVKLLGAFMKLSVKALFGATVAFVAITATQVFALLLSAVPASAQYAQYRLLDPKAVLETLADSAAIITPFSSQPRPGTGRAHTNVHLFHPAEGLPTATPQTGGPLFSGNFNETPASIACIYALVTVVSGCNPQHVTALPSGGSKVIAIVDAFDAPRALADLTVFSQNFGLPLPNAQNFQVVYATPTAGIEDTPPPYDSGWEMEISLDIQWAHAMAPAAKIILVEAASDGLNDLLAAVTLAGNLVTAAGGGQVSNSWGANEFSGQNIYDSTFGAASATYFFASGDSPGTLYPAVSPNVVAVGGTTISRNKRTGNFVREMAWSKGGGGPSRYEPRPAYQSSISKIVGSARGTPDVSAVADPNSGVWVYDSAAQGWIVVGGTSVATPILAGITNVQGIFRLSSSEELTHLYSTTSSYLDITSGSCGTHSARTHWDFCTGMGVPKGAH
jgi:kumamolisin